MKAKSFIDEEKINKCLENAKNATADEAREVLEKARELKGLSLEEAAILLQAEDKDVLAELLLTARWVKEAIYGKRLVIFAPLYLTNECVNNCLYCAFRKDNKTLVRKTLSLVEIRKEVEVLLDRGHKRILLVAGESGGVDYVEKAIETVYTTKKGRGEIRRVNVNVAPLSVDDFRRLKAQGIGTYQLFQETYHFETYKMVHPSGPKADFLWRLYAMDRAQEAGIDDVGIGVLFGLYDFKFEVLALLMHAAHLEEKFGVGPHTISVPRLKPAQGAPLSFNPPSPVSDSDFKKLVAILRLAVPYTGMILSTREPPSLRNELFTLGISQISAGSRTSPGGYSAENSHSAEQFSLYDHRTQAEVVRDVCRQGLLPSFCTACYRSGRTGKAFMELAKPGDIQKLCLPNALLTFKEYLLDYGDAELRKIGEETIRKQLKTIKDAGIKKATEKKLAELERGLRDRYF